MRHRRIRRKRGTGIDEEEAKEDKEEKEMENYEDKQE